MTNLRSLVVDNFSPMIRQKDDTISAFLCRASGVLAQDSKSSAYAVSPSSYPVLPPADTVLLARLLCKSMCNAVSSMSNMAAQHVGLVTSPCPVPLSATKPSATLGSLITLTIPLSLFRKPAVPDLFHASMACGVRTTVNPLTSMSTSHLIHESGTPNRLQASLIRFFETLSKALVMSHVHVCSGLPFSMASSSMFINNTDAVIVLRPLMNPC